MRVIGGKMRGTNLDSPKDRRVRPTTDRIKEDLFNILCRIYLKVNFWIYLAVVVQ